MTTTPEQILEEISSIIDDLGSVREQVTDALDRSAINNQIRALTKWWRKIDDERAERSGAELDQAKATLAEISRDLKAEKQKLTHVAVAIHRGAQAIAIAEKVAKAIT